MQTQVNAIRLDIVGQYVATARRWWWLFLVLPMLAAGAMYWYTSTREPTYTAYATLFVNPAAVSSDSSGEISAANQLTRTYSKLVTTRTVLDAVRQNLGISEGLGNRVKVKAERGTQLIQITAEHSDPQLAAAIANTTGEKFIAWLNDLQTQSTREAFQKLQASIDETEKNLEKVTSDLVELQEAESGSIDEEDKQRIASLTAQRREYEETYGTLLSRQQRLEIEQVASTNRVHLSERAWPPSTPSGLPNYVYVVATAMLALPLAGASAVVLDRTNERVESRGDGVPVAGLPVLASIPSLRGSARLELLTKPDSPFSEAIRSLRTRLQFVAGTSGTGTLVVTSPGPNEGKSIVAANLAIAFAQAGQRVVLVDGNLRRPRQHEIFGASSVVGFADLLTGVVLDSKDLLANTPATGLQLLSAGSSAGFAATPSDLLSGDRVAKVFSDLRTFADVVMIDGPPLLGVSDGMVLGAVADTAFIVAIAGRTRMDRLRTAVESFKMTGVSVAGIVLNETGRRLIR